MKNKHPDGQTATHWRIYRPLVNSEEETMSWGAHMNLSYINMMNSISHQLKGIKCMKPNIGGCRHSWR